ncbi:MAG: hypothetical protein NT069_05950, partial [Planctomycetota bacterium]|nr:hypothetical protein [Planctomycetota bacterium]
AQLFGHSSSRTPAPAAASRDSDINRELADIYRRNGREMPDMPADSDDVATPRSASSRNARAEVPARVSQPKPGFFGKLFGKGRQAPAPEDEAPPEPRRRLFGSRSQADADAKAAAAKKIDPKTGKKKNSELLDPKELEPLPPRSADATGRRNTLSAPKSSREGAVRREPVGLQPAEQFPDAEARPKSRPGVVPPSPDDEDGFFGDPKEDADGDSLDLSANSPPSRQRGPESRSVAAKGGSPRKPVDEEFGFTEPREAADEESLDEPADGDVPGAARSEADVAVTAPPEDEPFESAFDSPYTGAKISPREVESQRVEAADTPVARLGATTRSASPAPSKATGTVNRGTVSNSPKQSTVVAKAPAADQDDTPPSALIDETDVPPSKSARPVATPVERIPAKEQRTALKPVSQKSGTAETDFDSAPGRSVAKAMRPQRGSSTSQVGLMGYCPVTLKDTRQMAQASPEFASQFGGRRYEFASAEAKQAFDANPRRYLPAMNGQDVVRLSQGERGIEGTLDHAAWYRGKLYLFASDETLQVFVNSPSDFVSFP